MSDRHEELARHLEGAGLCGCCDRVLQAIESAGLCLADRAGDPSVVLGRTESRRVAIEGLRGAFLVGVRVGGGWLAWIEHTDKSGTIERTHPVVVTGQLTMEGMR